LRKIAIGNLNFELTSDIFQEATQLLATISEHYFRQDLYLILHTASDIAISHL